MTANIMRWSWVNVLFVAAHRHEDGLLKIGLIQPAVIDGELCGCAGIQRVQQLGVGQKHRFLVLTACHLIVDVCSLFRKPIPLWQREVPAPGRVPGLQDKNVWRSGRHVITYFRYFFKRTTFFRSHCPRAFATAALIPSEEIVAPVTASTSVDCVDNIVSMIPSAREKYFDVSTWLTT